MLDLTLDAIDDRSALSVPEDGDDLDALVVQEVFQRLGNRALAASTALTGQLIWSGDFAVRTGGTLTSFTLDVGSIAALYAADSGGTYRVGARAATTVTQADIEGGGGTLGAVARFWYVYAYLTTGGDVEYAISLTGPSEDRRFKGSDATRLYLGCFPTTAAGAPIPLRKTAGRVVYRRSALASNELRVLSTSTSGGPTNLDLSALVPLHTRLATLSLVAIGGDDDVTLSIFTDGDTSEAALIARAVTGKTTSYIIGDVETSAVQVVDRTLAFTGTTGSCTVHVHGFLE